MFVPSSVGVVHKARATRSSLYSFIWHNMSSGPKSCTLGFIWTAYLPTVHIYFVRFIHKIFSIEMDIQWWLNEPLLANYFLHEFISLRARTHKKDTPSTHTSHVLSISFCSVFRNTILLRTLNHWGGCRIYSDADLNG